MSNRMNYVPQKKVSKYSLVHIVIRNVCSHRTSIHQSKICLSKIIILVNANCVFRDLYMYINTRDVINSYVIQSTAKSSSGLAAPYTEHVKKPLWQMSISKTIRLL